MALKCVPRTQKDIYDIIIELIGGETGIVKQNRKVKEAIIQLKDSIAVNLHNASCLKEHFYLNFQKKGGIESLTDVLQNCKTLKDYAKLAYQIFISRYFIKKKTVFRSWYRTFCDKVGCEFSDEYKPSKLKLEDGEDQYYAFLHT